MTREELINFADHLRAMCMDCRHCAVNCFPSSCTHRECYIFPVRNLHQLFKEKPKLLEQLCVGNRRPGPEKPDTRTDRMVGK